MTWRFDKGLFFRGEGPVARLEGYDRVRDSVEEVEDGVFHVRRAFMVEDACPSELTLDVTAIGACAFYEIPCVTYNGNHWGSGVEPQGLTCNGQPWVYASHRSSLPGCTYSERDENAVCLFGDRDNPPFSMSLFEGEYGLCHRLMLPQVERPMRYVAKATWDAPRLPRLNVNGSTALSGWVVLAETRSKGLAIQKAMDVGARVMGHDMRPQMSAEQLWKVGIRFARESVYFEENGFKGFCMGLYYDAGAWCQRRNVLEIGWVGQNALMALSLIRDGLKCGDREEVRQGIDVLDVWQAARLPNGLFRCRYDAVLTHSDPAAWQGEKQDAANLYSVVVQYLRAWRLLKEHGIQRDEWRETALMLCRFGLSAQLEDGSFPRAWYSDGAPAEKDGSAGAYMAMALMAGWQETGDDAMLEAARRSFGCYFDRFAHDGYMTAGALDTLCIDKESGMPMLALALALYEATGESLYLDKAEALSTYLETWMYHYTVSYPEETLLGTFCYDTLGGTAVSTQHQHLDAYALMFVPQWVRLARYTGKDKYRRMAWEIWCNATQLVSDGTMVIDGVVRPVGSQDEGVCQTWWHTSRGEFRHTSRWLVCWNDAFRLDALADPETLAMIQAMESAHSMTKKE